MKLLSFPTRISRVKIYYLDNYSSLNRFERYPWKEPNYYTLDVALLPKSDLD